MLLCWLNAKYERQCCQKVNLELNWRIIWKADSTAHTQRWEREEKRRYLSLDGIAWIQAAAQWRALSGKAQLMSLHRVPDRRDPASQSGGSLASTRQLKSQSERTTRLPGGLHQAIGPRGGRRALTGASGGSHLGSPAKRWCLVVVGPGQPWEHKWPRSVRVPSQQV